VVEIKFTDAEYAAVAARATEAKVSIQRLLTSCALARRTLAASPSLAAELVALRRLTANLANNINQIARHLNSGGSPDAGIDPALAAVRRAMDRMDRALATTDPPPSGPPQFTGRPSGENPGRSP
jgi:hypothetical protein